VVEGQCGGERVSLGKVGALKKGPPASTVRRVHEQREKQRRPTIGHERRWRGVSGDAHDFGANPTSVRSSVARRRSGHFSPRDARRNDGT
jgi:hypothetical protein